MTRKAVALTITSESGQTVTVPAVAIDREDTPGSVRLTLSDRALRSLAFHLGVMLDERTEPTING